MVVRCEFVEGEMPVVDGDDLTTSAMIEQKRDPVDASRIV